MELVGPIGCVFILADSLVAAPVSKRDRLLRSCCLGYVSALVKKCRLFCG